MRFNIVKQVFKKEIIDILRDKKTLFMMVVLPIILYPLIMVGTSQIMMMSMKDLNNQEINIAFSSNPEKELIDVLNNPKPKPINNNGEKPPKINIVKTVDYKKAISEGKLDAYIAIQNKEGEKEYSVYIDSSANKASVVSSRIEDTLNEYKDNLVNKNIEKSGLSPYKVLNPITYKEIDVASSEEVAGNLLGRILPFILVIGILMGAIYPAIDVMAGEKERGTLETLFTLPISNLELVIGKYLSVSLVAVLSAAFNIMSMGLTMALLINSSGDLGDIGISFSSFSSLTMPILVTLICICIFAMVISAVSMCVCSLAKSFKEAQNYITPLMLIVMLPSYVSMIPNMELNGANAMIPVVNISLLIKSVLSFDSNFTLIGLVLLSNIIFVIISLLVLSKLFNSEEILFGDGRGFSFLEKRSNIKKGTMPKPSDGFAAYVVALVLLIYVGSYVQMKYGMYGIIMTQAMFLLIVFAFAFYIKANPIEVFSLRKPKILAVIRSLILYILGFMVVIFITNLILKLLPENMKVVEALNDALYIKDNILLNIIIIAGTPAICEELLFRGFIYSSLKNIQTNNKNSKKPVVFAILVSSLLFGIMHMNFIRIIPTTILGLIFSYSLYKSGSIFVPMLLHFINNTISVISMHYAKSNPHVGFITMQDDLLAFDIKKYVVLFIAYFVIFRSVKFIREKRDIDCIVK